MEVNKIYILLDSIIFILIVLYIYQYKIIFTLKNKINIAEQELKLILDNKDIEIENYKKQIDFLNNTKDSLKKEFLILSQQILDSTQIKAEKNLELLLNPFKKDIQHFNKKLELINIENTKQRSSLQQEIISLKEWTNVISNEASNLSKALLNDNKKSGNWGEDILKKLLESSGLRENHEFRIQKSFSKNNELNKRLQPDVIIDMPDNKSIIIDSKVSIKSYHQYISSNTKEEEEKNIKLLINSVNSHIKNLSVKKYENISNLNTLDFVIMFIPIESVFLLILEKEPDILEKAYKNNILLASPTSLYATLRGIFNVWKISHQSNNMKNIIENIKLMNEKFNNFIIDIEDIGISLDKVNNSYSKAKNKLFEGNGNLVKKSKEIISLGLKDIN